MLRVLSIFFDADDGPDLRGAMFGMPPGIASTVGRARERKTSEMLDETYEPESSTKKERKHGNFRHQVAVTTPKFCVLL